MLNSGMCSTSASVIMPAESIPKKTASEARRSNKPIMEKRRRARINNCLNELKNLILDAMKKDPARHSKLEKADILEMTVRHLQILQRHQMALAVAADPTVVNKYRAGFAECASEVSRFINRVDTVDTQVKQRLLSHLTTCMSGVNTNNPAAASAQQPAPTPTPVQPTQVTTTTPSTVFNGIQLVPTRLANGDIAFVVPSQYIESTTNAGRPSPHLPTPPPSSSPHLPLDKPLELTVPRPHVSISPISSSGYRTPSSLSPVSSEMSNSDYRYNRPIALIKSDHMRPGSACSSDEQPWRPW